jgi:hypothetical protein
MPGMPGASAGNPRHARFATGMRLRAGSADPARGTPEMANLKTGTAYPL